MLQDFKVGKQYKIDHKVGNGSFGEIYQGLDLVTKELVAVKLEPLAT